MTREQAKKNLVALGVEEPTDEQVTNYLNQHNGEVKKYQEDAEKWKKEAENAEELQAKLDGLEQQNLTELEKEKKAREAAEKRAADLQKQLTTSAVEAIFAKANLSGEEFSGMIGALSGLDLKAAKTSAESFVNGISKRDIACPIFWNLPLAWFRKPRWLPRRWQLQLTTRSLFMLERHSRLMIPRQLVLYLKLLI